eukprot:m.126003 g.126003  ORF g.126003 m.126003 type:complete len:53 (+) comp52224_c0_seq1:2987-3145(+)
MTIPETASGVSSGERMAQKVTCPATTLRGDSSDSQNQLLGVCSLSFHPSRFS